MGRKEPAKGGKIKPATTYVCSGCGGSGWVPKIGNPMVQQACNICGGSGKIYSG